jgi:predicted MFS family arabinose efflux permease
VTELPPSPAAATTRTVDGGRATGPGAARAISAAVLATAAGALPVFLLGGVAVQVRADLGFGEARLGLSVTLFFAISALASTTAGRWTERLGTRRAMVATAGVAAVALLLIAAAPAWWGVGLGLFVGALGNAFAQPASNLLLARGIDRARQGFAFGVKQGAVPLTSLLGGMAVPVFALTLGWRWAFVAGAVAALSLLVLAPRDVGGPPRAHARAAPELAPGARAPLVVLAIAAAFGNMGSNSLGVFLVESLVASGSAEAVAGVALMAGSAIGIASRVSLGFWADRTTRQLFAVIATMMLLGAIGYVLLATGRQALVPVAVLLTFGAGWGWNGLFSYSIVSANRGAPAAATGIAQSGLFFGAMAGPGMFGVVVEQAGFAAAWGMLAGLVTVASVFMLLGNRMMRAHARALDGRREV